MVIVQIDSQCAPPARGKEEFVVSRSHRSSRSFRRAGAVAAVAALSLAACGGGDDDDEAAATTAASTSPDTTTATTATTTATTAPSPTTTSPVTSPATTMATSGETMTDDDDDRVIISGLDELPQECVDAVAEFLRRIEPIVSDIDWDAATLTDFDSISDELEAESDILDEPGTACDDFDFASDEESLQALIEFAEDEAPGVVGWLEFIGQFSADPTADTSADGPQTCDEAIAYIEALADDGTPMSSIPLSELGPITQAFNVISTDCDATTAAEFFDRVDIADFMF